MRLPALFLLPLFAFGQKPPISALDRFFQENSARFKATGPAADGNYLVTNEGLNFLAKQTGAAFRFQYESACEPTTANLQAFLRESSIVKAYVSESGAIILEANLLRTPPPTSIAIGAFLKQFRQVVDTYRTKTEKFCAAAPKMQQSGAASDSFISSTHGKFKIQLNKAEWSPTPNRSDNIQQYVHKSGEAFAILISERVSFPLPALRGVAIGNAQKVDPEAKIVKEEVRKLSGRDVLALEIHAKAQGLPIIYRGHYYAGSSGTVQLVTFTPAERSEEYKPLLQGVLDSLLLEDEPKEGDYLAEAMIGGKKTQSINGGRIAVEYDPTRWNLSKSADGRTEWNEKDGRGLKIIIFEAISLKSEDLAQVAIANIQKAAEEYRVKNVGPAQLNGINMTCIDATATINKIPFLYHGCFWGGQKESYQFVSMTVAEHADELKAESENFWQGLRFVPALTPTPRE
jgi:hypothetical protein